jgi:hypothetical protein
VIDRDEQRSGSSAAVRALRSARQRKRLVSLEWFELAYKVYVAAIVVIGAVVVLSHLVGDRLLTAAQRADVLRYGPPGLGLVMALAVGSGLRSGARGGPLAMEAADVQYLLLAPVARRSVLMRPAVQRLRLGLFAGASLGALGGELLGRRWSGSVLSWTVSGAAVGATIGLAGAAAALVAHEVHLRGWQASSLATGVVAWQAAALRPAWRVTGPFDSLGGLVLWPLRVRPI